MFVLVQSGTLNTVLELLLYGHHCKPCHGKRNKKKFISTLKEFTLETVQKFMLHLLSHFLSAYII